jgi:co-chaperonin GroES (HSP10)
MKVEGSGAKIAPVGAFAPTRLGSFPWQPIGLKLVAHMKPLDLVRKQKSGIYTVQGESEQQHMGIIMALGAGEPVPGVGFVSMQLHYGMRCGDVFIAEARMGTPFNLLGVEYTILRPDDVHVILPPKTGAYLRNEFAKEIEQIEKDFAKAGDDAANDITQVDIPTPHQGDKKDVGEFVEDMRVKAGKATKTQIQVPSKET